MDKRRTSSRLFSFSPSLSFFFFLPHLPAQATYTQPTIDYGSDDDAPSPLKKEEQFDGRGGLSVSTPHPLPSSPSSSLEGGYVGYAGYGATTGGGGAREKKGGRKKRAAPKVSQSACDISLKDEMGEEVVMTGSVVGKGRGGKRATRSSTRSSTRSVSRVSYVEWGEEEWVEEPVKKGRKGRGRGSPGIEEGETGREGEGTPVKGKRGSSTRGRGRGRGRGKAKKEEESEEVGSVGSTGSGGSGGSGGDIKSVFKDRLKSLGVPEIRYKPLFVIFSNIFSYSIIFCKILFYYFVYSPSPSPPFFLQTRRTLSRKHSYRPRSLWCCPQSHMERCSSGC